MSARSRKSPPSGRWEEPVSDQRLAPLWRRVLQAWNHISPDPFCFLARPWLFCAALGLHNWLPKARVVFSMCVASSSSQCPLLYQSCNKWLSKEEFSSVGLPHYQLTVSWKPWTCSQIHRNMISKSPTCPDSFSPSCTFLFLDTLIALHPCWSRY